MVLQLDGVFALGRPEAGLCPGLELKTAVVYPQVKPSQRWMLAERWCAEDFLALLAGLLKQANVTLLDTLIGLGDRAAWVENSVKSLQAMRITDVYHATEYLEVVMQALDWDEATRQQHRRNWFRGAVNARDWLEEHLPAPDVWTSWDKDAQTALNYIDTRLNSWTTPYSQSRAFLLIQGKSKP